MKKNAIHQWLEAWGKETCQHYYDLVHVEPVEGSKKGRYAWRFIWIAEANHEITLGVFETHEGTFELVDVETVEIPGWLGEIARTGLNERTMKNV